MLLGISIEEAIEKIGHPNGTTTKEVTRAIGIDCRLRVGKLTDLCLMKLTRNDSRSWHWALKEEDTVCDPAFPYRVTFDVWKAFYDQRGDRVTSRIDLTPWFKKIDKRSR
jgi:hypothetical protein